MQLYKAITACTFGRGASNTFRAAIVRLSGLFLLSAAMGTLSARVLPPFSLVDQPLAYTLAAGILVVQVITLCGVGAAYGLIRPTGRDTLTSLLLLWPLKKVTRWVLLLLPGVILSCLILSFAGPILYSVFISSVSFKVFIIMLLVGTLSGLGYIYGFSRRAIRAQLVVVPVVVCTEYVLLTRLYTSEIFGYAVLFPSISLAGCFMLGVILLARSYHPLIAEVMTSGLQKKLIGRTLPRSSWFLKKLCRASVTKASWWATLVICSTAAWAAQRLDAAPPDMLSGLASLVAAAFTADGRVTTRRWYPPEICTLRGTVRFIGNQASAATFLVFLAIAPLIVAVFLASEEPAPWQGLITGLHVLLGVAAGLCAGALFAPAARDISAQSAAALLAAGVLLILEGSLLRHINGFGMVAVYGCLTGMLVVTACGIEYKRNGYYWRDTHA